MNLSILICCFNSEFKIESTLKYLSKQITSLDYEVILIDNGSDDNTISVINNFIADFNCINYYLLESPLPGKSNALAMGIKYAKGNFILICDDDNHLCEDYIDLSYNIISSNSQIGVLGGRSEPIFTSVYPFWFTSFQNYYAVGVQAINSGDISHRGYLWGAGSIFRRDVVLRLFNSGFCFNLSLHKGKPVGEDSELCLWFLILGFKLWYDESLFFNHYIPESRLTKNYLLDLQYGSSYSRKYLNNLFFYKKRFEKIKRFLFSNLLNREIDFATSNDKFYHRILILINLFIFLLSGSLNKELLNISMIHLKYYRKY